MSYTFHAGDDLSAHLHKLHLDMKAHDPAFADYIYDLELAAEALELASPPEDGSNAQANGEVAIAALERAVSDTLGRSWYVNTTGSPWERLVAAVEDATAQFDDVDLAIDRIITALNDTGDTPTTGKNKEPKRDLCDLTEGVELLATRHIEICEHILHHLEDDENPTSDVGTATVDLLVQASDAAAKDELDAYKADAAQTREVAAAAIADLKRLL
jgi:hypothetical protein